MSAATRLPRMLTIDQVATQLQVSPRTIRRWIAAGDLRAHYLKALVRIAEDDLAAFLNQHRQ